MCICGDREYTETVCSAQFGSEPKTALKNKMLIKIEKKGMKIERLGNMFGAMPRV